MPISPFICNEYFADAVARFRDRLVGFASVQPNLGNFAIEELEHAVDNLNSKGLKLHPSIQGFPLKDPKVRNCIKTAGELGIPVLLHCLLGNYSSLALQTKPAPWTPTSSDYRLLPKVFNW